VCCQICRTGSRIINASGIVRDGIVMDGIVRDTHFWFGGFHID
jgi:hypothetical protein